MHDDAGDPQLPWKLLGLNGAWYADILLTLTAEDARDRLPPGFAP